MFGIGKKKTTTTPEGAAPGVAAPDATAAGATTAAAASAPASDLGLAKGRISLEKRQVVSLTKTPTITVTISWPNATDYDVFALVQYQDGHVETVAQFGTKDDRKSSPRTADGTVVHRGDERRGAGRTTMADEVIDITLNPSIARIVPVVYSAQSNGTGSFRRYQVSTAVDNGAGDVVEIAARDADANDKVYTCVPAVITNGDHVRIEKLEAYSKPGSERRPVVEADGTVRMDAGSVNAYK
ncbi:TerD family protein [Curtobacterium sp. MCBA15_012]|uniref:TerD family protein n=1 Tax=Curtobacterium sp. MCBA15_012 TaxID=1898738 RepID=UPI0008DD7C9D|nr:TerD family protein [Curtobacterium sp. MCBA15_012]WIA99837.1 TerD family protein [Curtobacterium sp. MCBA15_012]